ncbi:proton-coupled folate transporter [Manduca sexta]|uniref:Proton-coupled folate transporter n=1 Tax=Manduca sexta TaxID=7130 RepID=A0A921ZFA5_MANSE|nr:proton-coupled folate transporter [Manduca sexta]XP_030030835.1 proton-coupled folate transporter [Manduca sexta]XP_030030836.1 proton-coupled folate transporter [Manduca sexta]XP_030030838.1 proton-coupled folate transporter [Manduca sexta]KAG6456780.1 hypothetical protein O3G_MSEX009941 [Manduca sexta]KAG6456781.1 hypothetical protein O3G_MSEX009941 [Manduca sexta]
MTESVRSLTNNEPSVNVISELPGKKFNITVDISIFLVMLSLALTGAAITNIIFYRTCVHALNYPRDECKVFLSLDKNNETQRLEKEVQQYATFIMTVKGIIESLAPAVLSLFLGVWSDTHGRKPLIVWPLFGTAITSMLVVLYTMLDNFGPWWFIVTVIPYSLTGGLTIMFTGAYCNLSDVTTEENRSLRMTILQAAVSAGIVVGSLLSPHVIRAVGNVYLLLIGTFLNVLAYAITNICLVESITGAIQGGITSVIDFLLVKEMIMECFKQRPNFGRAQILLLTFANSLSIFVMYGLLGLEYMYVREKLHWVLKDYTLYSAVNTTLSFLGSFAGIIIIQKLFGLSDLVVANIAFLSALAEFIIKTLAVSTWYMYFGVSISLFKDLSAPLLRSVITKILPVEDIAKVFALMAAIEGLCPLISPLLYNCLYVYTLSTLPAAIYILSSGITLTCIIFVGIVQYLRWNCNQYGRLDSP